MVRLFEVCLRAGMKNSLVMPTGCCSAICCWAQRQTARLAFSAARARVAVIVCRFNALDALRMVLDVRSSRSTMSAPADDPWCWHRSHRA